MKIREFKTGQKAVVKYEISSIKTIEVECRIQWAEDDRICLEFPLKEYHLAQYFFEGQEIKVSLFTDRGIRNYDSIVMYSPLEDDFILEYYEDASNIQRRQFVRVDELCDLVLYRGTEVIKTTTINIGGGGLRFQAKKEFVLGDSWDFSLYLPQRHFPVRGGGDIIHMVKQENSYDFAVLEFKNIRETERNKIIRACFEIEATEVRRMQR